MANEKQLSAVLNQVFGILQKLRVDGEQAELLVEAKKGIAFVNNELFKETQPELPFTNGSVPEAPSAP